MAISRSLMERQLRAGGGIMTLEEPRQGYFLGKIVKKAKRVVKKVAKSKIGKAALAGAALYGLGAFGAAGAPGSGGFLNALRTGGMQNFGLSNLGSGLSRLAFGLEGGKGLAGQGFLGSGGDFSGKRAFLTGSALATALPFFMGGGEEEEAEPDTSFTDTPDSIANIVQQARNQDPSLRFLPQPKFVRNFYAAGGGLADIPREGYDEGKLVLGEGFKSETLKRMAKDMFGKTLRELNADEMEMLREEFNISKGITDAKEGGIMDLGGMEKDYREGGFVPIGAEERADDVPARLSKNEFVFTADAVRNAGGGDIDKGAEVMQNMMDNLEAGGKISEESQGMNPAQGMFDQAQMLEGRLA